jgi:hypothetical protein
MIFSILPRKLLLILVFAVVYLSPYNAHAQCPNGKPPNADGTCGKLRPKPEPKPVVEESKPQPQPPPRRNNNTSVAKARPTPKVENTCSINVRVIRQGGEPLAGVNLMLDDSMLSIGVSDAEGKHKFRGLPCNLDYRVTAGHPAFNFVRHSITINNLSKDDSADFIASAREPEPTVAKTDAKPKPDAKPDAKEEDAKDAKIAAAPAAPVKIEESRPCNPPPSYLPKIKLGDTLSGKLTPNTSYCDKNTKGYFHSYQLEGAIGGDIIQFDLLTDPKSDMVVQVVDKSGAPIEVGAVGESDSPVRRMVVPAAGEYTLRIIDRSNRASDYRLNMTRKGLSDEGYRAQLDRAYAALADPDKMPFYSTLNQHIERFRPFSDGKSSEQKISDATAILEQLRELAPNKPEAYSILATINLYYRKDLDVGRDLAMKAVELGGEARFRVNIGEKLEKDARRVSDVNSCWLSIRKEKISCESFKPNEGEVFTSTPLWLANKAIDIPNYYLALTLYGKGKLGKDEKRGGDIGPDGMGTYYFVPTSLVDENTRFSLTEVATIKNIINQFVELQR